VGLKGFHRYTSFVALQLVLLLVDDPLFSFPAIQSCTQSCMDGVCYINDGNPTCRCNTGYIETRAGICTNINECDNSHSCEHVRT